MGGYPAGNYHHKLDDPRQFIYKICVRSGSLIDGIKFYYKTPKDDSYTDYILTESPFYGGNGGVLSCFEDKFIDFVYVRSGFYVEALLPPKVLKSVEVYDGTIHSNHDYINSLKFNFMDSDTENYMICKFCQNGEISC